MTRCLSWLLALAAAILLLLALASPPSQVPSVGAEPPPRERARAEGSLRSRGRPRRRQLGLRWWQRWGQFRRQLRWELGVGWRRRGQGWRQLGLGRPGREWTRGPRARGRPRREWTRRPRARGRPRRRRGHRRHLRGFGAGPRPRPRFRRRRAQAGMARGADRAGVGQDHGDRTGSSGHGGRATVRRSLKASERSRAFTERRARPSHGQREPRCPDGRYERRGSSPGCGPLGQPGVAPGESPSGRALAGTPWGGHRCGGAGRGTHRRTRRDGRGPGGARRARRGRRARPRSPALSRAGRPSAPHTPLTSRAKPRRKRPTAPRDPVHLDRSRRTLGLRPRARARRCWHSSRLRAQRGTCPGSPRQPPAPHARTSALTTGTGALRRAGLRGRSRPPS